MILVTRFDGSQLHVHADLIQTVAGTLDPVILECIIAYVGQGSRILLRPRRHFPQAPGHSNYRPERAKLEEAEE